MANEKNLIPIEHLSTEEAKKRGSAGGKKSGEVRRRKKALKSLMNDLLSSEVFDTNIYNQTAAMGISPEDMSYGAAIVAAMVKEAAEGNVKAFNAITDLIGEGSNAERVKIQRRQLKLQEQKLTGDTDTDTPDDGFLEALSGSAAEDWSDEED